MKFNTVFTSKFLKSLPLWMLVFSVAAQEGDNMVPNGSFEDFSGKLRRLGMIEAAEGWSSPTGNSSDLFSADAHAPDVMTPENVFGKEEPKDGLNYAGLITYSYNDKENRSYMMTQLSTPMKKGMRYKVMFYVALAELSKYSSNSIGVHFSKRPLTTSEKVPALVEEMHVEHPEQEIFTGTYGWDLVCGEYVAEGGEKYITIGNFYSNNEVGNEKNKKPKDIKGTQIVAAYYYVDDVSVRLLGPNDRCDCPYATKNEERKAAILYQVAPSINEKMTLAEKVNAYHVFYLPNRYNLTPAGNQALEAVAKLMQENPDIVVEIAGNADSDEAADAENSSIGKKRADYVRSELVNKGIDASRLKVVDRKNDKPASIIEEVDTDDVKDAKNRRVSFNIIQ